MTYSRYFAIEKQIKAAGFPMDRHTLIEEFTEGKKQGLRELSPTEYKKLCNELQNMFINRDEKKKQLMRRKIIALFHKMNYKLPSGKANMDKIESWCEKYGQCHKKLNAHSYKELVQLTSQVERMYGSYLKALEKN